MSEDVRMVASRQERFRYTDYCDLDVSKGVFVFSDGSTWNNGGRVDTDKPCIGGYGWVVVSDGAEVDRGSGGEEGTSISRMELLGVIEGLKSAQSSFPEGTRVTVVSDSQYVIRGACEYLRGWLRRGWKNNEGQPTANVDLWKRLVRLSNASGVLSHGSPLEVHWSWVKGHQGHVWNEECDVMATAEKDSLLNEASERNENSGE